MIIESVAKFLENNSLGTVGEDIFIGELPLEVGDCVALVYAPSPDPNVAIDIYEQTIDFWSRNKNSGVSYSNLLDILELLHKKQNYSMEGFHVYFSNALGMVMDNDRDSERRKLYQLSIKFIYRKDEE
jgi:hypothetical protein